MQLTATYDELKAAAERRRRQKLRTAPPAIPVNLDGVRTLGQPREFQLGGVGYRAPPLPYRTGLRLLVAAEALARGDADAIGVATTLLHRHCHPRRWLLRLLQPLAGNPFTRLDPEQLEGCCWFLLVLPDEQLPKAPDKPVKVDYLDGVADFARAFPAWLGGDGLPRTWEFYLLGCRHLARLQARTQLTGAIAARSARWEEQGWEQWQREMNAAAGWN